MAEKTAQDIQVYNGTAWRSLKGQKIYDGTAWKEFQGIYDGTDWWRTNSTYTAAVKVVGSSLVNTVANETWPTLYKRSVAVTANNSFKLSASAYVVLADLGTSSLLTSFNVTFRMVSYTAFNDSPIHWLSIYNSDNESNRIIVIQVPVSNVTKKFRIHIGNSYYDTEELNRSFHVYIVDYDRASGNLALYLSNIGVVSKRIEINVGPANIIPNIIDMGFNSYMQYPGPTAECSGIDIEVKKT